MILPDSAGFDEMVTNLGIAASIYDPQAGRWSQETLLTSPGFLNRSARLAGPSSTNLILIWTANSDNDLEGSVTTPNELWFSRWNGTVWTTPEMFATVPYPLLKYDLSYDGAGAQAGERLILRQRVHECQRPRIVWSLLPEWPLGQLATVNDEFITEREPQAGS